MQTSIIPIFIPHIAVLIAVSFVISGRLPGIEGFRRLMRCAASLPLIRLRPDAAPLGSGLLWRQFHGYSRRDTGRPAAAGA